MRSRTLPLLVAGARLNRAAALDDPEHVFDATEKEVGALLRGGPDAPTARELSDRAAVRRVLEHGRDAGTCDVRVPDDDHPVRSGDRRERVDRCTHQVLRTSPRSSLSSIPLRGTGIQEEFYL